MGLKAACIGPALSKFRPSVGDGATYSRRLKKLSISVDNLSTVDLGLLTSAVNRLEEVFLWGLDLTVKQWEEVITAIGEGDSRLKKFYIEDIDLSKVDPCLLARAVNRLEEMDLFGLDLSIQQWEAILTATGKAECKMKILNMNSINLTTVNPKLLASAVNRIGTVRLCETQLTGEQWEAIFTAIRDGNSKMKELYIPENNFTTVSPSLLASAVNMLEEVNMSGDTELTLEQVEAILTQSLVKTSTKSINKVFKFQKKVIF